MTEISKPKGNFEKKGNRWKSPRQEPGANLFGEQSRKVRRRYDLVSFL